MLPRSLLAALALVLLLLAGRVAVAQQGAPLYDFYARGPYRSEVPRPDTVLGYEVGKTNTTFRDQERVILALAEAAKDRVRVTEYGRSVEGRPLRLVLVS